MIKCKTFEWAQSVAAHMQGWRAMPVGDSYWQPRLKHDATGAYISILGGDVSRTARYTLLIGRQNKISIAADRPAKEAAADITRRGAQAAIDAFYDAKDASKAQAVKDAAFKVVCAAFEQIGFKSYHGRRGEAAYHHGKMAIEAYSCSPESWNIKISDQTPETIFKIVALLEAQS